MEDIAKTTSSNVTGISDTTVTAIQSYLSNRWRLRISISDIMKFSIFSLFCFCCKRKKDPETYSERKIEIYKKGEEMIIKELDCVNIMTKLRQLELITSLFLNSKQKFLLNFQKKNLISEKSNLENNIDSSSSDDDSGTAIFRQFSATEGVRNKGFAHEIKLHEALKTYSIKNREDAYRHASEQQLVLDRKHMDHLDQKILFGIFTKNPHFIIEKQPPKIEEQTVSRLENASLTFNIKEKDRNKKIKKS